jgi:hypothetical protein
MMDFEAHRQIEKTQKAIDEIIESFRFDAWSTTAAHPDPLGLVAAHLMIIGAFRLLKLTAPDMALITTTRGQSQTFSAGS